MARRIPLPRLSRRQRMARWQRERRQRLVSIGVFTAVLFFALGLVGWALASNYYDENLRPAATVAGRDIPMREFSRKLAFDRVKFLVDVGVPEGQENDPQLRTHLLSLRKPALDAVVLHETLMEVAREQGRLPTRDEVGARVAREYGQLHVRHILIAPDPKETDKQKADADAKAKADELAAKLRAAPGDDQLWKDLAAKESGDPGSQDNGGDLGWVGAASGFVKEFEDAMFKLGDGDLSDPVKSSFGYHIIQRIESRPLQQTPLWARLRAAGIGMADVEFSARTLLLKDRYETEAREAPIPSPQEQVHAARILVRFPPPTNLDEFARASEKMNRVINDLGQGRDFAEVAKELSDDLESRDKGGDVGWLTRAMLPAHSTLADQVFKLNAGGRTEQITLSSGAFGGSEYVFYKVLEKDPAHEVTVEQKEQIKEQAFRLWLRETERRLAVLRLVPSLEF